MALWIGPDGASRPVRLKGGWDLLPFRRSGLGHSRSDLARGYSAAVWAYRCIKLRADAVAGVPLLLLGSDGVPIEGHPLIRLLRDVNPRTMNLGDLVRATEAAYNIWGVSYWLVERMGTTPRAIYWLNPQTVEPVVDAQRGITAYRQMVGGRTRMLDPADVIAFRNFNPLDDLGGLSPLGVVLNEVNAEISAAEYVAAFFANDTRPAGLLTTDQPMVDSELERVQTWWQRLFGGPKNSWKTGIVGSGLRWQPVSQAHTDLALVELRAEDRRAICAAFGVPPGLAGAWESVTYATAREQKASFYEDTMLPQKEYLAEVLNWSLVARYPDLVARGARLAWDVDSITALRESATDRVNRLRSLFEAGSITRNEVRAELGLPLAPVDGYTYQLVEEDSGMAVKSDWIEELNRWERFAVRRVKEGRHLRPFRSDVLPDRLREGVQEALADVVSVEDVRGLFNAVRDFIDDHPDALNADLAGVGEG
ncbi:MAG: phage portal protein [Anaerolineae bacterium]